MDSLKKYILAAQGCEAKYGRRFATNYGKLADLLSKKASYEEGSVYNADPSKVYAIDSDIDKAAEELFWSSYKLARAYGKMSLFPRVEKDVDKLKFVLSLFPDLRP